MEKVQREWSRRQGAGGEEMMLNVSERGLLLFAGSCLSILSCSALPEGDGADGARWYAMQHCNGCHGRDGTGGRAPALRGVGLSYGTLRAKVRNSGSVIMPSYSRERLSDEELADIFAYLNEGK